MSRSSTRRPQYVLLALALVCAGGLIASLMAAPPTARAERRFRELLDSINAHRWHELPEYFDPELALDNIRGPWPGAMRRRLREMRIEESALRALLEPLKLRLRIKSTRSSEDEAGLITLSNTVNVRGQMPSGMVPPAFEEGDPRGRDLDVTTTWKEIDGRYKLASANVEPQGLAFPRLQ